MIDPWDNADLFDSGDSDVQPVATAGEFGTVPAEIQSHPRHEEPGEPNLFFYQSYVLVAGAKQRVSIAPNRPDYWSIKAISVANGLVYVYPADDVGGAFIPLDPGAKVNIPGTWTAITLFNQGAVTVTVCVMAVRGYRGYAFGY